MPHPTPWIGFEDLVDLCRGQRLVVLTGAGVSTESGIPDYRGPETRKKSRNPVQYNAFVRGESARRHYWARSAIGWPTFASTRPNPGHDALARLERHGYLTGIITQNVDRLHQSAGSQTVVELHGALDEVVCLDCMACVPRHDVQERMLDANPGWTDRAAELAPDGDAELPPSATAEFVLPTCTACGGTLKPNVVFFGENVPADRVNAAWSLCRDADVLLVAGSSLTVYSGYRFVHKAHDQPVGIVNLGPTRGDDDARICVDGPTGSVLPALADALL